MVVESRSQHLDKLSQADKDTHLRVLYPRSSCLNKLQNTTELHFQKSQEVMPAIEHYLVVIAVVQIGRYSVIIAYMRTYGSLEADDEPRRRISWHMDHSARKKLDGAVVLDETSPE